MLPGIPKVNKQLSRGDKHLLRLVRQDQDAEGWAKVSLMVWPLMQKLPSELVTLESTALPGIGGRAKLTGAGETVLDWT